MSNSPPHLFSSRFSKTLWTALSGSPAQALVGLYWFIARRRVRGWARLLGAAAASPRAYKLWTRFDEFAAYQRFRLIHPRRRELRVQPLIIAEDETSPEDVQRSLGSIREAFGYSVPVYATRRLGVTGCEKLVEHDLASRSYFKTLQSDWLLPVVAGDVFAPGLGEALGRGLVDNQNAVFAFWDEDRIVHGVREDPWIKPSWDPYLFSACSGLVGASAISMRAVHESAIHSSVTINRSGLENWLFALASQRSRQIVHIPLVLTHRIGRRSIRPTVPPSRTDWPKVSILIPTRDRSDLLEACLISLNKLSYPGETELLLIDNGTIETAALQMMRELEGAGRVKVVRVEGAFNFSRLNNIGAREATGEVLCLLNNDVEALDGEWLTLMVGHCLEEDIGAVGALLLYPDRRVQHAGVVIGMGGAAGHVQRGVDVEDAQFSTWHQLTREVSAVTAATMVLRKQSFLDVGGFDEQAFPVAFNDVDLCLRLKKGGLRNLYVAEARLVHHESVSRGEDRSPEKARRFAAELKTLQQRWGTVQFEDPHFSPLFSKAVERCMLQF